MIDPLRVWAETFVAPPCPRVCDHVRIDRQLGPPHDVLCLDCGASWSEHSITISDDEYDNTLAFMAQRLDSK